MTTTAVNPEDGQRLRVRVDGPSEGNPAVVLFLHGTALSGDSWRGLGYVRALRDRYRVVTVDLRGHGHSDKPHDSAAYSMDRQREDIAAVIRTTVPEGCHLHIVGYSFGGRLALELAVRPAMGVTSAVLIGATHRPLAGRFDRTFFPGCADVLRTEGMERFVREWEAYRGAQLDASTRNALRANDPLALAAFFDAGDADRMGMSEDAFAGLSIPTLWIVGDRDELRLGPATSDARTVGGTLLVLPGRRHSSTLFPSEPLIEAIRSHLDGVEGAHVSI